MPCKCWSNAKPYIILPPWREGVRGRGILYEIMQLTNEVFQGQLSMEQAYG
jgi:hypothetical protein